MAEAIRYDLLTLGLRLRDLGTAQLTWADLLAVCRQSPHGSALQRALQPEDAPWGLTEQLLALIADVVSMQFWADHNRRRSQRPKAIPRPGVSEKNRQTYGDADDAMSMDEFDAWLESQINPN